MAHAEPREINGEGLMGLPQLLRVFHSCAWGFRMDLVDAVWGAFFCWYTFCLFKVVSFVYGFYHGIYHHH